MLIFHSLSAVTIELPTDVEYPLAGTDLVLTCKTSDSTFTKYAFYKGATELAALSATNTYTVANPTSGNDGDYHCIAADGSDKKSAETSKLTIAFKGKSFLIHHSYLLLKQG